VWYPAAGEDAPDRGNGIVTGGGTVDEEGRILEGESALRDCLDSVARAPRAVALLCDIDGTISPIASRPADAFVPARFGDLLRALVDHLGAVAFVTGRAVKDGRRMVDVDGATYVGTHGLEVMGPDGAVCTDPQAERYVDAVQAVAAQAAAALDGSELGIVLEDKRTVLAVHYRLSPDPERARHEILSRVIEPARARGLTISTGHFLFEVRPPIPVTKGTVARRLLAREAFLTAVFCGDDLTDVTGFEAIHRWAAEDARRTACAVAAVTKETPRPVLDEADVRVAETGGVHEVLRRLLAAAGG